MADPRTQSISQILVKAKRGGTLTPEEEALLRESMKSVAPASQEYQYLSSAMNAAQAAGRQQSYTHEDDGPFNFGPPTLDFLMGSQNQWGPGPQPPSTPDARPTPAAAAYDQGSAPIGTDTQVKETGSVIPPNLTNSDPMGWEQFDAPGGQGWGPVANSGYGNDLGDFGADDVADVNAVDFPKGYSFSGSNETAVDMFKYNPELYNKNIVENVLKEPGMDEYWGNRTAAAMNMANFGLLGKGSGRQDLGGGPTTTTGQLAATEDFMKQFAQPGVQTVDPGQIYEQIFQRALATDWDKQSSRQHDGPMGKEEQIQVTNEALLTSMGFSNPETEQWMTSLLENAAQEYMMYLAQGGDTSVSYPRFLDETMGFSDLL